MDKLLKKLEATLKSYEIHTQQYGYNDFQRLEDKIILIINDYFDNN